MPAKKHIFFVFLFLSKISFAAGLTEHVESQYFTIYYQQELNPLDLAYEINIGSSMVVYKDQTKEILVGADPEDILAEQVDILFNEVSDILDMHLYSYHGEIKIYKTQEELQEVFKEIFGKETQAKSFYSQQQNTIYISAQDLKPGVLGHEMAHAIMCHYFVVVPPMKAQEVLAGYVEYSINKKISKK